MTSGHFVWTDLSTYDMAAARVDYDKFFGWSFGDDPQYDFASNMGRDVTAIFPMPNRLAQMNMPSFWMSYVHVDDLDVKVAQARNHEGVIIEVEPQAFGDEARIALVRDPSGAGFTMYEGPEIAPAFKGAGDVVTRFHHLPDVKLIEAFYADLFGWSFRRKAGTQWPVFDVQHPDGTTIAQVEEVPEEIRGKYRYWMPCFRVHSVEQTVDRILAREGQHYDNLPGNRALVADRQGAHFLIQGVAEGDSDSVADPVRAQSKPGSGFAWKAMLGLGCVWLAVILDVQVFWGALFLLWTWPALRSGRADFIEPVARASHPVLYWALISTWAVLSAWLIVMPFVGTT